MSRKEKIPLDRKCPTRCAMILRVGENRLRHLKMNSNASALIVPIYSVSQRKALLCALRGSAVDSLAITNTNQSKLEGNFWDRNEKFQQLLPSSSTTSAEQNGTIVPFLHDPQDLRTRINTSARLLPLGTSSFQMSVDTNSPSGTLRHSVFFRFPNPERLVQFAV